jgi:glycosyltransferase involved in cell wall biosynthesis
MSGWPGRHPVITAAANGTPTIPQVNRLSVVVPFFDVVRYAPQTLHSLAANVDPRIQFVLVDDASTDGTTDVLAEAVTWLSGATVVTLPHNRGLSAARNAGLDAADGNYLTFLDGDDAVTAGYFPALLDSIVRLRCDFIRTDHVQTFGSERTLHRVAYGPRNTVADPRTGIGPAGRRSAVDSPNAWSGAYHRDLLDSGLLRFDEDLRTCEDRPWIWRLHLQADSFAVVGLHGVRYRREVSSSLTQLADERQLDFLPAFGKIISAVRHDRDASWLLPKAVRSLCAMICHHLSRREFYPAPLASELTQRCSQTLIRLGPELDEPLAGLDPFRGRTIRTLLAAA